MSLLVRKIEKGKWLQNDIMNGEDVSADAITNCIKTVGNTLSVWQIEKSEQIDDAVLAIVSAHEHLDTIDVVCIKQNQLNDYGIDMQETPGRTPVVDLTDRHVNITNLTYRTLGKVAQLIIEAFCTDNVKRYTRGNLKKMLHKAIESGRLNKEDLESSVSNKL